MKAANYSDEFQSANGAAVVRLRRGFTLIEIMVVVGIMGIILGMGVPSLFRALQKEGMRKGVSDVMDVCSNARARAILSGEVTEVICHPLERRFEIGGAASAQPASAPLGGGGVVERPAAASSGAAAQLPADISIEMLDINLREYCESDVARFRFFPNGMSDEVRIVLLSNKGERRGIELEFSTGLVSVVTDVRELARP